MKKIVILCAGDFGKELIWLIEDINGLRPVYEIIGFLDDDEEKIGKEFNGYKCIGKTSLLNEFSNDKEVCAVIATQESRYRKKFVEENPDFQNWETLIHPSVHISKTSEIGVGCVVCANCNISVNTIIGNHCILNLGVTVGHDCELEDFVSLMTGAVISGHVTVSQSAYLGTNSVVVPGKTIGKNAKVGAGSVAIRNVKDNVTVMGVPAKVLGL